MILEKRIRLNVENLSFPRLSGTEDEEKALRLIFEKVKDLNLDPKIQNFQFSTFFARTYPKIGFLLGFVINSFLYFNFDSILSPFFILAAIALLIISVLITRNPEKLKLKKILNSANLHVKLPIKKNRDLNNPMERKTIIFCCHMDSKGQKFTIQTRIIAIRAWVFSSMILLVLNILKDFFFIKISFLFLIIGIIPFSISLFTTIILLLNTTNNSSPGAIDDASGIACVFELLNHYSNPENRLNNFEFQFVFTGAEECGTMGIRFFFKTLKNINKDSILFFNFDSIARSVYLFPTIGASSDIDHIYYMFLNNKRTLRIKSNPKKIYFGSHSDGYFMKKKGFQGFGIGDMDCYKYIHSIYDKPDKIDYALLRNLCEEIIKILETIDRQL